MKFITCSEAAKLWNSQSRYIALISEVFEYRKIMQWVGKAYMEIFEPHECVRRRDWISSNVAVKLLNLD